MSDIGSEIYIFTTKYQFSCNIIRISLRRKILLFSHIYKVLEISPSNRIHCVIFFNTKKNTTSDQSLLRAKAYRTRLA